MVLHARVVLDLYEKLEQEISFEQVEGDFDSFEGKWILEQLGNQHTLLKYTVESKMHRDSFLSEAIMEEVSKSFLSLFLVATMSCNISLALFIYFFNQYGRGKLMFEKYSFSFSCDFFFVLCIISLFFK